MLLTFRCCTAILLVAVTFPLAAQAPPDRPWTITAFIGPGWGGPGADMDAHLRRIGGWESSGCGLFGCLDSPSVDGPGVQWSIGAGRRIAGKVGARGAVSGGGLGSVLAEGDSGFFVREWSSTTLGVLITVDVMPEIWVGTGPTIVWRRSDQGERPAPGAPVRTSVGVNLQAGFQSSARKPVFFTVTASYRLLPSYEEGPYPKVVGSGEVPPYDANFSCFVIGAGVGARWRLP